MIKYHLMVSVGNPDYDVELGNEAYLIVGKFLGDSAADCIGLSTHVPPDMR